MQPHILSQLLGSDYSLPILRATHEPNSAHELSEELEIPIATVYRRLHELTEKNLLEEVDGKEGHPKRYQRTVDEIQFTFEADTVDATVQERYETYQVLADLWHAVKEE